MKINAQQISVSVNAKSEKRSTAAIDFGNFFKLEKKGLGIKARQRLYADLYLLLNSGLDLRYALQLITQDIKQEKTKVKLNQVKQQVIQGQSLSESLKDAIDIDDFEYFSLKIGEETGRIADILNQLAEYFDARVQQRRQILSALSYPVIVLLTAIGAVVFMLQVVVPLFQDVFQRFGKELPQLTQSVIAASDLLSVISPYLLLLMAGTIIAYPIFSKRTWYSRISAQVIRRIPIFGAVITKMHLLRLVSALELMLSSNTNLVKALQLAQRMTKYHPLNMALEAITEDLIAGKSLSSSMSKFDVFDSRFLTLIQVGEEVNQLPSSLSKLRLQYEKDIDIFSKTVGSILEPAIILFIGVFVGAIIIAMYLPMFELSTLF